MKRLLVLALAAFAGSFLALALFGLPLAARAGGGAGGVTGTCSAKNADVNADGNVDVSDAVSVLGHLFLGNPTELLPLCAPKLPAPGHTVGRFLDNGDGTVSDTATGLMWQQDAGPQGQSWQAAVDYCAGLSLAGHDDWRLPNIRELESLLEFEDYDRTMDSVFAYNTHNNGYWANTGGPPAFENFAYSVDFKGAPDNGTVASYQKTNPLHVRAVRSGP